MIAAHRKTLLPRVLLDFREGRRRRDGESSDGHQWKAFTGSVEFATATASEGSATGIEAFRGGGIDRDALRFSRDPSETHVSDPRNHRKLGTVAIRPRASGENHNTESARRAGRRRPFAHHRLTVPARAVS